ncbi:MAG TPA: hypothetical protein VHP11_07705 [Tepidisphaeraceae bacterium]|nr:hypothetical protein [Tepidisphaeraceae bacterium]
MLKHFLCHRMRPVWALVLGASLLATSQAWADTIAIRSGDGVSGVGSFSGTLSYDQAKGELTIVLNNTSPTANSGYITGLAFNVNGNLTAHYLSSGSSDPFEGLSGGVNAQPWGYFEVGTSLGSNWEGGGTPRNGIGVNESGTFVFKVEGDDADALTAMSFISEGSVSGIPSKTNGKSSKKGGKPQDNEEFTSSQLFAVRFRGFGDGKSDKVPGQTVLVPLPAAAWSGLALLGVLGVGGIRRRMYQN